MNVCMSYKNTTYEGLDLNKTDNQKSVKSVITTISTMVLDLIQ